MERAAYREMADLDQRHWWYQARRRILEDLIRRTIRPPKDAQILEIGCGTGHNLDMLGTFGHVDAIELDDESRAIAEKRLVEELSARDCRNSKALRTASTTSSQRSTSSNISTRTLQQWLPSQAS